MILMKLIGSIRIWGSLLFSAIAIYALIGGREISPMMPALIFFFGVMLLIKGISERKENNKSFASLLLLVSAFNIIVSIYIFSSI